MSQDPSDKLKDILHINKSPIEKHKELLMTKASLEQTKEAMVVAKAWDYYRSIKETKIAEVLVKCSYVPEFSKFFLDGPVRSILEYELKLFPRTKGYFGMFQNLLPLPYETQLKIMEDFQSELNAQNIIVRAIVAYSHGGYRC